MTKETRLAVGTCLANLLKFNLINGSLSDGNGVFVHGLVKSYVVKLQTPEELRELQKSVVEALLSARPKTASFCLPPRRSHSKAVVQSRYIGILQGL